MMILKGKKGENDLLEAGNVVGDLVEKESTE